MKNSLNLILGITILLIFSYAFSKSEKGCEQFKIGRFKFNPKGQPEDFYFSIQRNDSTQIETDTKSEHFSKYSIKWPDKCNYELILLETSYPHHNDSLLKISKTTPLKTEILSWTNDYYVFKAKRDNVNLVMIDTMWVEK